MNRHGPTAVLAGARNSVAERGSRGGENVSSIEVEDCLFQHPAVAEAAVIGVPDERCGETVKAIVVLRAGIEADENDIVAHCRARLAHFKRGDRPRHQSERDVARSRR